MYVHERYKNANTDKKINSQASFSKRLGINFPCKTFLRLCELYKITLISLMKSGELFYDWDESDEGKLKNIFGSDARQYVRCPKK